MKRLKSELHGLQAMVFLMRNETERLHKEMVDKKRLQERYRHNIEKMSALCQRNTVSDAPPTLTQALNGAHYKTSAMHWIALQQQHLRRSEEETMASRQAWHAALLRYEVMMHLRDNAFNTLNVQQQRREQKEADELAQQVWWRARCAV